MLSDGDDVTAVDDVNATTTPKPLNYGLYVTYNVFIISTTVVIMFSMGTSINIDYLRAILKRPLGPVIGFVSQCFVMPACCFGYAVALSLPDNIAIGMVLIGSCPGGSVSNIMTFWAKADIVLSVCMTTISTTLAVGFLPLNMFIYSRYWVDDMANLIPYSNMVMTVAYNWVAVIAGYFVGRKWPKATRYCTRIGSVVALILILFTGVIQSRLYTKLFDLGWRTYLASVTMPMIGFAIGYLLSWAVCLVSKQRVAIGFETGIQNTAIALTVIAITYPTSWKASYYSQYVILYATFQIVLSIVTIAGIWIYDCVCHHELPQDRKTHFSFESTVQVTRVDEKENEQLKVTRVEERENEQSTVEDPESGFQLVIDKKTYGAYVLHQEPWREMKH